MGTGPDPIGWEYPQDRLSRRDFEQRVELGAGHRVRDLGVEQLAPGDGEARYPVLVITKERLHVPPAVPTLLFRLSHIGGVHREFLLHCACGWVSEWLGRDLGQAQRTTCRLCDERTRSDQRRAVITTVLFGGHASHGGAVQRPDPAQFDREGRGEA